MRCLIGWFLCLTFSTATLGQGNLTWEEHLLLSFIGVSDTNTPNPSARIELYNQRGDQLVGYAWRMAPSAELANTQHAIFAPGFDAQAIRQTSPAGSIRSYLELAKQLSVGWKTSGKNFPTELVQNQNNIVWLIDYLDRRASVQANSKAVQALLRHPEYKAGIGRKKSVLYGYSMGGLVARHALLFMEDQGLSHNVGAYVSLDAPHRGAFLPPALETSARTINSMIRNGLSKHAIGTFIREDIKQLVAAFDSDAARQLLGIYIGRATPKYKYWPGGSTSSRWKNLEHYYKSLIANNDLARHPAFFNLREELVDMGSYPALTLNIGVSFGRADGARLMPPYKRSTKPASINIDLPGNTQILSVNMNSIRGYKLCRIETTSFESGRSCPNLGLLGQSLESVFVSPGSTSASFSALTDNINALPASDGVDIRVRVDAGEERLTFIPMVSAFDSEGWARDFPNNRPIGSLRIPFDVAIADTGLAPGEPGSHTVITSDIIKQITARLFTSSAYSTQKSRAGGDASDSFASPTSNFWTQAGNFNIWRYISPNSIRDLPVISNAKASAAPLLRRRDDNAVTAAIISLM